MRTGAYLLVVDRDSLSVRHLKMGGGVNTGIVYGLCDPASWEVRYVGFTRNPRRRLRIHLWHTERGGKLHVHNWLRSLGCPPAMIVLDEAPCEELPELERKHIATLRAMGCRLTNLTSGGDGGALEGEALERRNATYRKGMTPQRKSAIALTLTGRKKTPEAKASHQEAMRLPETRAKLREAALRQWERTTPEQRAATTAKKKAYSPSPETRAKIAAAQRNLSAETRARMSESQKRRWQREREARADG